MGVINKDIKAFSIILSGTTLAQIASFCFAPILARLYSAEDFGIAALFFAIVTVLVPALSLRYNHAVFMPKDDDEAGELISLSTLLVVASSLFVLLVILLLKPLFTIKLVTQLGAWVYLLPLAVLIHGETEILKIACTRWKKHKTIASSEVVRSTTTPLVRIICGVLAGSNVAGLIFSMLVAHLAGITLLWSSIKQLIHKKKHQGFTRVRMVALMRKYKDFPILTLPTAILLNFSDNMLLMFFGQFFSANLLGILGMTRRLIRIPANTINNALRTVLIPIFLEKKNQSLPIIGIYSKLIAALFFSGLIPFVTLLMYGESMFGFYLGKRWADVGRYATYMAPIMFTQYINTPVAVLIFVLRRQRISLFLQLLFFGATLLALIFGYTITKQPGPTILFFSLTGSVVNLLGLGLGFKLALAWDKKIKA